MAKLESSQSVNYPAPYRGMNTENMAADPNSGHCRLLSNFCVGYNSIFRRPSTITSVNFTSAGLSVLWFDTTLNRFLLSDGSLRDAAAAVITAAVAGEISTYPAYWFQYRNFTLIMNGSQIPVYVDTTTGAKGAWPFATVSATMKGGCTFKNRPYIFNDTLLYYPALPDAVAGALLTFDLTSLLGTDKIVGVFPYSGNSGLSQNTLLAIYSDGGKVILYSGSNPSATDWSLQATFFVTKPRNQSCIMVIDGDIVCAGEEYMYSLSELIAQGAAGVKRNSVSNIIRRAYASINLTPSVTRGLPFIYYLKELDAIVISNEGMKGFIESYPGYSDTCSQFVYFRQFDAWAYWTIQTFSYPYDSRGLAYYTHLAGTGTVAISSAFNLTDQSYSDLAIDQFTYIKSEWRFPYIKKPNGNQYQIKQLQVQTNVSVNLALADDFSKNFSAVGNFVDYYDVRLTPTGIQKISFLPMVSTTPGLQPFTYTSKVRFDYVLIDSSNVAKAISPCIQVQGSTDYRSTQEEIYGLNVVFEDGGVL